MLSSAFAIMGMGMDNGCMYGTECQTHILYLLILHNISNISLLTGFLVLYLNCVRKLCFCNERDILEQLNLHVRTQKIPHTIKNNDK